MTAGRVPPSAPDGTAVNFFRTRLDFAHTLNSIVAAVGRAKPVDHISFMIDYLQSIRTFSTGRPQPADPARDANPATESDRTRPHTDPKSEPAEPQPNTTATQQPLSARSVPTPKPSPDKHVRLVVQQEYPWRTAEMEKNLEMAAALKKRGSMLNMCGMPSARSNTSEDSDLGPEPRGNTYMRSKTVKLAETLRAGNDVINPTTMPLVDIRAMKKLISRVGVAVSQRSAAEKAAFIAHRWMPFVRRLHAIRDLARERAASELNIVDRIPIDNYEVHDMMCECLHLTGEWYGHGKSNIALVYEWFVSTCEAAGISKYSFDQIRTQWSKDKFLLMVDSTRRSEILARVRQLNEIEKEAGEWTQQQGVSAIDNTLLNNIFTAEEATQLLASEISHKFIVVMFHVNQLRSLRIIGEKTGIDLENEDDPEVIKGVLDKIPDRELTDWGITPENVSFRSLRRTGKRVWNWGQLPAEDRKQMHKQVTASIARRTRKLAPADPFLKFVKHHKERPGEYFEGSREKHLTFLFIGMIAGKVVVVTRSEMERHTKAKYLAVQWKRKCDLIDASNNVVRPASTIEHMRIRINEAGYAPCHGMSLSGTGVVEDTDGSFEQIRHSHGRKGVSAQTVDARFEVALAREMNLPRDPGARLANWYLIDIEKILHEVRLLNPPGVYGAALLPFEKFFEVGQNPKIGSSIAATQHTQVSAAALSTWPIYQQEAKPCYCASVRATLDVVQVGWERDAIFLKVKTHEPTFKDLVQFLCDLKSELLRQCPGGMTGVDFNVKAMVDDIDGGFIVVFAPVVQLQKSPTGSVDEGLLNPDTGEVDDGTLPVCKIDTGKGGGLFMISAEKDHEKWRAGVNDGEHNLRRLYDFCRKPGVRDIIVAFVKERLGASL
eukprot:Hpha_TRINITY_DN15726_c0_g4::TRINITY_DN15726_c0_g4_i1::g.40221::m.40221